ncbi:MAG: hypothetical protein A2168_03725 [Planctomycetes bacterium RBG_13_50_24]|nr:MAG: hypothetical protein A2168_03725 [Planctomycetes bacterium RBG_13_50_24]
MIGEDENNQNEILDKVVQEFLAAQLRGEEPNLDEFVRQYPGLEKQIRQKIQNCQRVSSLFDSLREADENEFKHAKDEIDLIGKRLGAFEITEVVGRGGMGVVYKGHDIRLDRIVAIKSIPAELQANLTARARFTREAKLLASLNHPNIAVIHDIIEQAEGISYLILEYIPGETLAQRIAREPLKLQEALLICQQVAEAVSAAHEKGVVHRDLKPGNIKITPENRVKVLDFGLAKISVGESESGETTVTQAGRVIGTPAYMSPEQARGKSVDRRTDIWSFGCVLYETLTGRLPFEGETATDTLACIIEREPDWEALPQRTPMNIRALLRRCLEKDPNRRLRDLGDAVIEISETLSKPTGAQPMMIPVKSRKMAIIIVATIAIVLSGLVLRYIFTKPDRPSPKQIRLVVLPFENLGSAEDEYFAAGITDAITARLGTIHELGVISRQSAMQYKKREKTAQQIANDLGIDYILEGTVQRERPSDSNSRVRITPRLIKAADDTHVWAQAYDNDMSDVFRVQSDVAERVAQALNIALLEPERRALQSRPTENMEAYDYFLRGNEYWHRSVQENDYKIAIQMYEKVVELDPEFALAYAQLSKCHAQMYWEYYDHTLERLKMAKKAMDRAVQLEPDLPEVHWASGNYYYRGHLDYDLALDQFAIAQKSMPNDSDLLCSIGYVQRRQGKFDDALANLKRASELDPLSNVITLNLGQTFMLMRNYPEALHCFDRGISLAPDLPQPYDWKALLYLCWEGRTQNARLVVDEALKTIRLPEEFRIGWLITLAVYDGDYSKALDGLSSLKSGDINTQYYFVPRAMRYASIFRYMNDNERAKECYDEARTILEDRIQQEPNDARFRSALGIAYAGVGRIEDAIQEGKKGVDLLPITKEAWGGTYRVRDLALIYVMVGEFDSAIDQIEILLPIPGELSIPLLRLEPDWNPLRGHPRFKKLLEEGK